MAYTNELRYLLEDNDKSIELVHVCIPNWCTLNVLYYITIYLLNTLHCFCMKKTKGGKLKDRFVGPYKILSCLPHGVYNCRIAKALQFVPQAATSNLPPHPSASISESCKTISSVDDRPSEKDSLSHFNLIMMKQRVSSETWHLCWWPIIRRRWRWIKSLCWGEFKGVPS